MSTASPTALRPRSFRPTWEVGASLGVHALLAAGLFVGEILTRPESKPLLDPSQIMMVTAVALPRQTTRLPERPTRTPDPPKVAPAPEPSNTPPPPPTASDLVLHKDDAPKPASAPEQAPDRTQDRQELLRQMQKQQALKDMTAALGDQDRPRTDPNGVDPEDAMFGASNGLMMDKEAAAWWSKASGQIWANWTPLPATVAAHPSYVTFVKVKIAADGTMSDAEIYKSSSDSSFDRTAILAIAKTGRVQAPPAKFVEQWSTSGTIINFPAKEGK